MRILTLVVFSFIATGCLTTHMNFGPEAGTVTEEDEYKGAFGGAVNMQNHCKGKIAKATLKRELFAEKVTLTCAK